MTIHHKKKNQSIETDQEIIDIQMIELVDKDIKTVIVTIFHMFKKVEERLNILSRVIGYILKDPNPTIRKKNSVLNENSIN